PDLPRVMDSPAMHTSRGYHLPAGAVLDVIGPGTAPRLAERAAPISEMVVAEEDGVLVVRHLGSPVRAPLLSVMQNLLYHWCDQVPPLPHCTTAYAPRVRFGPAVLRRRQWLFDAEALAELNEAASVPAALIAAARLQARHGLPARLFVKSPEEPKPVYVDLESPLSVELLIKLARKAPRLRLSEMYPDDTGLWLEVGGRPHTSELRFTYVLPA
ncbi:MAG TPA: lantibiotic dehydratase, partial [Kofleriaceae bacterium]|nr:lantibiotic dehydratase [Kofleriaceae bacterium]